MTSAPFFSVVIPTRNRPDLVLDTVDSVLRQDFPGVEIILSDNSSNNLTERALSARGYRAAIDYIRPPRAMSMPEHWEFATQRASGQYVLVLTDRSVLKRDALRTISAAMVSAGDAVDVCSWGWSLYDDELGTEISTFPARPSDSAARFRTSSSIVASFARRSILDPYALPRGLNSCYSATIARDIRRRHGTFFRPLNPDFTSAFLLLAHTPRVFHIDAALFVSRGMHASNGGNAYALDATAYLQSLAVDEWYWYVPIKSPLIENIIFEDFLAMRALAGDSSLGQSRIDWVSYFRNCYRELLAKRGHGLLDPRYLQSLFAEWRRGLGQFGARVRLLAWLNILMMTPTRLKYRLRRSAVGPRLLAAHRRLRAAVSSGTIIPPSVGVMEAAGFPPVEK